MANPACTFCEQNEGVLMATNLIDGETIVACGPCLPGYALGMTAALTEGMTKQQAEAAAPYLDAIHAHDPRGPRAPAGGSRRKPKAAPPPEAAVSVADSPAAASVALLPPCDTCGSETATGDAVKLVCDGCGAVIATADDTAITTVE